MSLFRKRKKYPWEEEEDKEEEEYVNPANWSVRQELENAFNNHQHEEDDDENIFKDLDTSNMNLRQELEAKFNALNQNPYQTKIMPDLFNKEGKDDVFEDDEQHPYIFSENMRNLLGQIESGNDYTKVNPSGGGFGALGKYQIRRDGFKDIGYVNQDNQWVGRNNIYSNQDYLNNEQIQEQALDDFMQAKYKQLRNNGSSQYLGYPIKGIVENFDITDTGLLAASHREGAGAVHNYLSHLEKDQDGHYYIDYDKISDPRIREMFKRIETRLRRFAR